MTQLNKTFSLSPSLIPLFSFVSFHLLSHFFFFTFSLHFLTSLLFTTFLLYFIFVFFNNIINFLSTSKCTFSLYFLIYFLSTFQSTCSLSLTSFLLYFLIHFYLSPFHSIFSLHLHSPFSHSIFSPYLFLILLSLLSYSNFFQLCLTSLSKWREIAEVKWEDGEKN